jgi:hypothetical protein
VELQTLEDNMKVSIAKEEESVEKPYIGKADF